jgi:hypothetical protein
MNNVYKNQSSSNNQVSLNNQSVETNTNDYNLTTQSNFDLEDQS